VAIFVKPAGREWPRSPGCKEIDLTGGFWFEEVGERRTRIIFAATIDPHIALPALIINWVIANIAVRDSRSSIIREHLSRLVSPHPPSPYPFIHPLCAVHHCSCFLFTRKAYNPVSFHICRAFHTPHFTAFHRVLQPFTFTAFSRGSLRVAAVQYLSP